MFLNLILGSSGLNDSGLFRGKGRFTGSGGFVLNGEERAMDSAPGQRRT